MKAWVEIISTAINEGNCLKILSNVGFARQKGSKLCDARVRLIHFVHYSLSCTFCKNSATKNTEKGLLARTSYS